MTTTFRVTAFPVALLALASACSAAGQAASSPTPSRPSSAPTAPAVRAFTTCFTAAPAGWAGAQRASLPTTQFLPAVVTAGGDRVYGFFRTAAGDQGIAAVDLASGALTRLVAFPAGTGGAAMAVDPPWVAWSEGTSAVNPGAWTLEARNLDTGEQLTVATPGSAQGGAPGPVLSGGRVAWAQPTSSDLRAPSFELRVYDLAAHRQTVLDSGSVGAPVLAGRYLVWSRAGAGLQAVDAATLRPAELPERVRYQTPGAGIAGSPAYLVWTTDAPHVQAFHATVWSIDRDQLATYTIGSPDNTLQFLTIAGHYLIWFTSVQYAILDLDTGGGYDVALPGTVVGSEGAIVRTSSPDGTPKGAGTSTVVSVLPTASAPAIPACGR